MKINGKSLKRKAAAVLSALMLLETVLPGSMISFAETMPEVDFLAEEQITAVEAVEAVEEEPAAELAEEAVLEAAESVEEAGTAADAASEENAPADDGDEETDAAKLRTVPAGEMAAAVATEGMTFDEKVDAGLMGFAAVSEEDEGDIFYEGAEVGFEIDDETGYLLSSYEAEALPKSTTVNGTRLLGAAPSSYDGRENFTSAKNQKGHNTCWAFSTAALAEASMIKQGKAQKASVDYSELGLAYFMYNDDTIVDPLGLTVGHYSKSVSGKTVSVEGADHAELTGRTYASVGGNPLFSMMALSGWKGMQNEADLPYTKIGQTGYTSDQCYGNNQAILKESRVYNLQENASLVKEAIQTYGGATIELHAGSSTEYVVDAEGRYCFWNDTKVSADHSAVIVGWDDTFPKENFGVKKASPSVSRKTPEKNGAWLVRNSWGSGFGENGYFWLSYEDKSLGANAVVMSFLPADSYENNYHYDGTGGNATCTYKNEADGKTYCYLAEGGSAGNIYRASEDSAQLLTAVSVGFATVNTGYSIQIYTNTGKMANPMDGLPALKKPITGTSGAAGIYLIEIPSTEDVYLTKGEYFSVVVTATKSPYTSKIVQMYTDKNLQSADGSLLFVNATEAGQSFVKSNSTSNWVDLKKSSVEAMRTWTFRLKAMTKNVATRPITPTDFSLDEVIIEYGRTEEVSFRVTPANATWENITCTVGNTSYATGTVDAKGRVMVKGLKRGTTDVTCTISWKGGSLTANAVVRVVYRPDDMYFSSETKEVKKGSTATLAPTFSFELENGKKTTDVYVDDYTFEWNSDDTSIVTVTPVGNGKTAKITAKAEGQAWISVTCVDNRILGADICVSVTTSGGGGGGGGGTGGGGGGGGTPQKGVGPGMAAGKATFSKNWFQDANGQWKIKNKAGQIVTSAWICDDAVTANGQNVWYLLDQAGNMIAGGCVQDATGNIYSLEMNHNGYFGMLRYKNGNYTCEDGTTVYLEFSQAHDGTFGAVINQAGKDFLIRKYGITQFGIGNQNIQYTKSFE